MRVAKWGNSLAVRLPRSVIEALGLKEGDEITLAATGEGALRVARDASREAALDRVRELSRPLPPGFRFSRDDVYETARNDFRKDDDGA